MRFETQCRETQNDSQSGFHLVAVINVPVTSVGLSSQRGLSPFVGMSITEAFGSSAMGVGAVRLILGHPV